MLRFLTAGESHGQALGAIIEGLPAGLALNLTRVNRLLEKRQAGYGRGPRMALESDRVEIFSGVRGTYTLGSPLLCLIYNQDWQNWQKIMAIGPEADLTREVVRAPRPGHADLAGGLKYQAEDLRNILERASARETAIRVAVGAIAKELLFSLGIKVQGRVVALGGIEAIDDAYLVDEALLKGDSLFCLDREAVFLMCKEIEQAKKQGDSLGGIIRVVAEGVPPGLGSHVHWDRRLDGLLAQAVCSIPAIKGVEMGLGFALAALKGSQAHDPIGYCSQQGFQQMTNQAGGIEGGISNGAPLVLQAVMKPIPTLSKPLASVDWVTKEATQAARERADVCAVPAAAIVVEAVVAWVLAVELLRKFGGDHLRETKANYKNYLKQIKEI